MKRITTNVHPIVKEHVQEVKKEMMFKTESEAIEYLYWNYQATGNKITMNEHKHITKCVQDTHRQGVL